MDNRQLPHSRTIWTIFSLCVCTAIAFFFIPAFIIRPFRYQSPRALVLALSLRQHAPIATLIACLISLVLAIVLWNTATRLRNTALVAAILLSAFSATMSRLNYFEWMFHPIDAAQFIAASQAKLSRDELIMSVQLGGDSRAYPISQMAYHHVLNDVVGATPIAVTY
jgi:uncharacterized SAM-binding protein YcdF (DUF218 family)